MGRRQWGDFLFLQERECIFEGSRFDFVTISVALILDTNLVLTILDISAPAFAQVIFYPHTSKLGLGLEEKVWVSVSGAQFNNSRSCWVCFPTYQNVSQWRI